MPLIKGQVYLWDKILTDLGGIGSGTGRLGWNEAEFGDDGGGPDIAKPAEPLPVQPRDFRYFICRHSEHWICHLPTDFLVNRSAILHHYLDHGHRHHCLYHHPCHHLRLFLHMRSYVSFGCSVSLIFRHP
jgi:hypothetical protein